MAAGLTIRPWSVRELLLNTIKHAHTQKAMVTISRRGSDIQIAVKDNGVGFNIDQMDQANSTYSGFGLLNIRERLNFLGGTLYIESAQKKGTRIVMTLPLNAESEGQKGTQP